MVERGGPERRFAQRFVLDRQLGSGGMARVFLGRDEVLGRSVAVKVLYTYYSGTDIGERFRREGRTAAKLSHRNIVQVYDAGETEFEERPVSYIVMEYVCGGDLKGRIVEQGRLPEAEVARLGYEVAAGLAHAHERGVIHRDIKPHNVLLDSDGQSKLTDFGIARALDATQFTRTGSFLGTALYAPPEQLHGEQVTPRSDVYSLGVMLYYAAVGSTPFEGDPLSVAQMHDSEIPEPPSVRGAHLDAPLERLILDCLQKRPQDRPQATEVRQRLKEISTTAPPTSAQGRPEAETVAAAGSADRPVAAGGPGSGNRVTGGAADGAAGRAGSPRRGRGLVLVSCALVVAGIAAIGFSGQEGLDAIFGGGTAVEESSPAQPPGEEAGSGESSGAGPVGQESGVASGGSSGQGSGETGQNEAPGDAPANTPVNEDPPAGGSDSGESGEEGAGSADGEDGAVAAVEEMYSAAAASPGESWGYLSGRFQQELGSEAAWTGQFQTLESIEFSSGPEASVSGTSATADFSTVARHTDRTDRQSGTASLVLEGGEWRIDQLSFS